LRTRKVQPVSVVEGTLSRARKRKSADPVKGVGRQVAEGLGTFVERPPTREFPVAALDATLLEQNCVLPQVADRAAMHSYKFLRTRLLHRLASERWRSVAVTSIKPGEGKTLTSINLAVALSRDPNTRVCLADFDLLRPQVAIKMGLDCEWGLDDYLLGDAEPRQVMYRCGPERLIVIPNKRPFGNSSEMLASARMTELLKSIETEMPNHVVIFDMPPLTYDDVLSFAPRVDGVLLVVAQGQTKRADLTKAKELLAEMKLVGVVLNRSTERNGDGYYYY
jgi:protein-tyrosine kinase